MLSVHKGDGGDCAVCTYRQSLCCLYMQLVTVLSVHKDDGGHRALSVHNGDGGDRAVCIQR